MNIWTNYVNWLAESGIFTFWLFWWLWLILGIMLLIYIVLAVVYKIPRYSKLVSLSESPNITYSDIQLIERFSVKRSPWYFKYWCSPLSDAHERILCSEHELDDIHEWIKDKILNERFGRHWKTRAYAKIGVALSMAVAMLAPLGFVHTSSGVSKVITKSTDISAIVAFNANVDMATQGSVFYVGAYTNSDGSRATIYQVLAKRNNGDLSYRNFSTSDYSDIIIRRDATDDTARVTIVNSWRNTLVTTTTPYDYSSTTETGTTDNAKKLIIHVPPNAVTSFDDKADAPYNQ